MFPQVYPYTDWKWQELRKKAETLQNVTAEQLLDMMNGLETEDDYNLQSLTSHCIRCHIDIRGCGCDFSRRYFEMSKQKVEEYQKFMDEMIIAKGVKA